MYLLDSNVFIEASRLYYHPDITTRFWTWIKEQHEHGQLASVAAVRSELTRKTDSPRVDFLHTWVNTMPKSFWLDFSDLDIEAANRLAEWAQGKADRKEFRQAAVDEFFAVADFTLVAQARAGCHKVVTREQPAPKAKKRIRIPDACDALGVERYEPFEVYRKLGLRLDRTSK